MRWNEIFEAPIDLHALDYPNVEGKPNSFRRDDQYLHSSPKHVEKIKQLWKSSVADVICYIVNVGVEPETALDIAQYGHDPYGNNGRLGDLADLDIKPTPGKITVIYTNNEGARRVPMTGWIIAHRLMHAFAFASEAQYGIRMKGGYDDREPFKDKLEAIAVQYKAVMGDLKGIYAYELGWIDYAHTIGSTRACRDGNLSNSQEFLPEHFAQYMLRGKVTLNPLPPAIKSTDGQTYSCTQGNLNFANKEVQAFEDYLNREFPKLIELCKGRIFSI